MTAVVVERNAHDLNVSDAPGPECLRPWKISGRLFSPDFKSPDGTTAPLSYTTKERTTAVNNAEDIPQLRVPFLYSTFSSGFVDHELLVRARSEARALLHDS